MSSLFIQDDGLSSFVSPTPESSVSQAAGRNPLSALSSSAPSQSITPCSLKRKRKVRAEATWSYFRRPEADEQEYINGNRLWYCQRCHNPKWHTYVTTTARRHLRERHGITVEEVERTSKRKRQQAIEVAFLHAEETQVQRARRGEEDVLRKAVNPTAFYEAQIQLITRRRLPYNCVTWPEYQALLLAVNYTVEDLLIESHNTVPVHIDRSFNIHRESLKARIQRSKSLVHFSIDLWSSLNRKAFLGIHAQWVDENYGLKKALLSLPNIRHSHSGEAMSRYVLETIRTFNLASRFGYYTGDNGSANDTCLRAVSRALTAEFGVSLNPVHRRIRCGGHIINLSLEAFLFASTQEALKAAIEAAIEESSDTTVVEALQEQLKSRQAQKGKDKRKARGDQSGWRSIGAMGKLHNIAVYIRSSTLLSDAWADLAGKALGIDNATRWNSWFELLTVALEKQGELMLLIQQHYEFLGDDVLTPTDWELLRMTAEFLQPFWQATQAQQKEWASLDQVLYNMDILFKHFEDSKVRKQPRSSYHS
jgi:hypothetical protein